MAVILEALRSTQTCLMQALTIVSARVHGGQG